MQLPSGFPVKIEIPLFHVINARITFSNIQVINTGGYDDESTPPNTIDLFELIKKMKETFCFPSTT